MRTVIGQFRNEEYLLPFWLRHHREIFDHGVLIDYHSTDRSREIIRELVPDWECITSENKRWDGIECDFEIMLHERRFEGWKIALNITEFLCSPSLDAVEKRVEAEGREGAAARGVIMVDPREMDLPDPDPRFSLVGQRFHGNYEDVRSWRGIMRRFGVVWPPTYRAGTGAPGARVLVSPLPLIRKWRLLFRSRLYHRARHGAYLPGRHASNLHHRALMPQNDLLLLHFYFSPYNEAMVKRVRNLGDIASLRIMREYDPEKARQIDMPRRTEGLYEKGYRKFRWGRGIYDMRRDPYFHAATQTWQKRILEHQR